MYSNPKSQPWSLGGLGPRAVLNDNEAAVDPNYGSLSYGIALTADARPVNDNGSNDNGSDHGDAPKDSGGDDDLIYDNGDNGEEPDNSIWLLVGKAVVILLVIIGLIWAGSWVWQNYSDDDSAPVAPDTTQTTPDPVLVGPPQEPAPVPIAPEDQPPAEELTNAGPKETMVWAAATTVAIAAAAGHRSLAVAKRRSEIRP